MSAPVHCEKCGMWLPAPERHRTDDGTTAPAFCDGPFDEPADAAPSPEKMAYDAGCTAPDKSRTTAEDFADGVRAERARAATREQELVAEVERLRAALAHFTNRPMLPEDD